MVEDLKNCIRRYKRKARRLKNRDPPPFTFIITEAEPEVIPIEKGDAQNNKLWTQYMRWWHPRGFNGSVGRSIRFLVIDKLSGKHIAALSLGTPVYALKPRDDFIGWTRKQRERKINKHVANNWRFLMFPYVDVKNLGSRILSQFCKVAATEWMRRYDDRLLLIETFVDESECEKAGVIYKAAGWLELLVHDGKIISHLEMNGSGLSNLPPARTKGYSFVLRHGSKFRDFLKGSPKMPKINAPKKIFLKPLHRYWRKSLCEDGLRRSHR
jgi:hypothetical protein